MSISWSECCRRCWWTTFREISAYDTRTVPWNGETHYRCLWISYTEGWDTMRSRLVVACLLQTNRSSGKKTYTLHSSHTIICDLIVSIISALLFAVKKHKLGLSQVSQVYVHPPLLLMVMRWSFFLGYKFSDMLKMIIIQ